MDACERLSQLKLTEIQQREIIRVILHCCGNVRSFPQSASHTQSPLTRLAQEKQYLQNRSLSGAIAVFVLNRYSTLLYRIANLIASTNLFVTFKGSTHTVSLDCLCHYRSSMLVLQA